MRIGILTYYNVHNHGAVLQANALQNVLRSMGCDVEFLTFERNYDMIPKEKSKKYSMSLRSLPYYLKYMLIRGTGNVLYNFKKNRILYDFRKNNLKIGGRYTDFDGDTVVIGSDEVFSIEIGINPFFFGHGLKAGNIFCYAGCFGPTTKDDIFRYGLEGLVASGFERIGRISARDRNTKDIVESISKKTAEMVCDPVILYGYGKEMNEFVPDKKDYILLYSYDRNCNESSEIKQIRRFAAENNLKVYSVGYYHKWCDRNIQSTPKELLAWIRNAKFVITDTFHGAVISLICNTQFAVRLRTNRNKLAFLMGEYGLSDRIVNDMYNLGSLYSQRIDFDSVNKIIREQRQASFDFIKSSLNIEKP